MFYFARCMNIIFNSLLVKYDVHTTCKIKFIHTIFFIKYYYFILLNGWICLHGVLDEAGSSRFLSILKINALSFHFTEWSNVCSCAVMKLLTHLLSTRKVAWYIFIGSMFICLSVSNMTAFESIDTESLFSVCGYVLRGYESVSYMKVIMSR